MQPLPQECLDIRPHRTERWIARDSIKQTHLVTNTKQVPAYHQTITLIRIAAAAIHIKTTTGHSPRKIRRYRAERWTPRDSINQAHIVTNTKQVSETSF